MRNQSFYEICNNIIKLNGIPRNHQHLNTEMLKNQSAYIISEVDETLNAIRTTNRKELIDGLADVLVTVVYWEFIRCKHSSHFQEVFEWVMTTTQDKIDTLNFVEKLHVLKEWVSTENPHIQVGRALLLVYSMIQFVDKLSVCDFNQLKQTGILLPNGDTLMEAACKSVEASNFSKFPQIETVDLKENIDFIKQHKGLEKVGYRIKDGLVAFIDESNDKFQKPKTFQEPDLQWVNQIKSLDLLFTD